MLGYIFVVNFEVGNVKDENLSVLVSRTQIYQVHLHTSLQYGAC
jgi:hypothetical protein